MSKISLVEKKDHIARLLQKHKIMAKIISSLHARACRGYPLIYVPEIKSDISYMVVLHEIGHCVTYTDTGRLEREANA